MTTVRDRIEAMIKTLLASLSGGDAAAAGHAAPLQHEGHVDEFFVGQRAVPDAPVLEELLAVIRRDDD